MLLQILHLLPSDVLVSRTPHELPAVPDQIVGMHTPEMISELRSKVVKADGMGTAKTSVFKMLGSNKLAPLMKVARNFQDIGLKKTAGGATARINLGKMGIPSDRLLPSLAHQSLNICIHNFVQSPHKPGRNLSNCRS